MAKYRCPICKQQVDYADLKDVLKALPKDIDIMRVYIMVQASCGHRPSLAAVYRQAADDAIEQSHNTQG